MHYPGHIPLEGTILEPTGHLLAAPVAGHLTLGALLVNGALIGGAVFLGVAAFRKAYQSAIGG